MNNKISTGTTSSSLKTTSNTTSSNNPTNMTIKEKINNVEEMDFATENNKKDSITIANEVLNGKWGNGEDRKTRLKEAGYNPEEIQSFVNGILNGTVSKDSATTSQPQTPQPEPTPKVVVEEVKPELKENIVTNDKKQTENKQPSKEKQDKIKKINKTLENITNEVKAFFSKIPSLFKSIISPRTKKETLKTTEKEVKKENKEKSKTTYSNVADPSNDKSKFLGLGEKTTLFDKDGSRVSYKKKKELDDGTIEYYDKKNQLIKRVKTDGTCEFFEYSNVYSSYYDSNENKIYQSDGFNKYKQVVDKIIVLKDGTKEYYNGKKLVCKEMNNGTHEVYKEGSFEQKIKEIHNEDGSYKEYKERDGKYYLSGDYKKDGSYEEYSSDGIIMEKGLADGTTYEYFKNGKVALETKKNGDTIEYYEDGVIKEKTYDGGYDEGGITEYYSKSGNLLYKYIKSFDNCEYYGENGKKIAYKKDDKYTIYNKDGTTTTYEGDDVVVMIDSGNKYNIKIELGNGKQRCIYPNSDYVYNSSTGARTYTIDSNKTVDDYSLLDKEKINNILTQNGFNIANKNLPSHTYTYINYDNGKVSSAQLIDSGMSSKHSIKVGDNQYRMSSFITTYDINTNGTIEKRTTYFKLKEGITSYEPKKLLENPEQYIETIYEQTTEKM